MDTSVAANDPSTSGVAKANAKKKIPIPIGVTLVVLVLAASAFKTIAPKIFIGCQEVKE